MYEKKGSASYVSVYSGAARSISLSGRVDSTYYYRVRACNDSGCGGYRSGGNSLVVKNKPGTPGTPNNPSAEQDGDFPVSWSAASGNVTYYNLQQSFNGGAWSNIYTGSSRSTSVLGLSEGTYKFRVKACNTYSWSCTLGAEKQTVVDYPDTTAVPNPPATNNGSVATISWGVSFAGFILKEDPTGREWQVESSATSYVITAPSSDGDNYQYSIARCMVINEGGGASSEFRCGNQGPKGSAMVVRHKPGPTTDPILSDTTSTDGVLGGLGWSAPLNATKYYVQKELNNSGSWVNIGGSLTGTNKSNITGLGQGDWRFRIKACNEFDWSCSDGAESALFKVRNIPSVPTVPDLSTDESRGSVGLDWPDATGATYYDVQKQKNNSGAWLDSAMGRATSDATVSGLPDGVWNFQVHACNEFSWACSDYGPASSDVTVRVSPGAPGTPDNPGTSSNGVYNITWAAASGNVTHYLLQESVDGGSSWNTIFTDAELVRSFSVNKSIEGSYIYRVKACNEFSWACTSGGEKETSVDFPNVEGAPSVPPKSPGTTYVVSWHDLSINGFILTEYPSGRTWQGKDADQLTISAPADGKYSYSLTNCFVFNEGGGASDEYRCGSEGPQSSPIEVRKPPVLQGGMDILINATNGDITVGWPAAIPNGDYYQVMEVNTAVTKTVYEPNTSVVFPARANGNYTYEYYACNNLGNL